ncbi:hypothetical protein D8T51_07080 [Vibrio vulnificus]|uniref:hypothetical protein n=1 Tax=Vibrio vulnificus TaxID=672 RepID=UPI00102A0262|nr:hypothetical protein [Vibrio vulnificus]RZP80906.1 hypothetical protein D8T51_07080 [Vibrio vulnificus]
MNEKQVFECIHGFFQEEHVQKAISTIGKCKISGWEGWLQVEFANYLETKVYGEEKKNFDWYREYKIITKSPNYDANDEQNKYIIPDFWISSDQASNAYYLIEFKRSNTGAIVSEMKVDIEKWLTHMDSYKDALECASESGQNYKNLGVFFVGVDTKPTDEVATIEGVSLNLYGASLKYRIGFLSVDTMVFA